MKLKIKRLTDTAKLPIKGTEGSAGYDLFVDSIEIFTTEHTVCHKYKFGIAAEIPYGYVGLLCPRSSIWKTEQVLANSVGVIDPDYRGEIMAVMRGVPLTHYKVGERAIQLVIVPAPELEIIETDRLSNTIRGAGGFGSTGI